MGKKPVMIANPRFDPSFLLHAISRGEYDENGERYEIESILPVVERGLKEVAARFVEHLMNIETIPNPNLDVKRERYWMQDYVHFCPVCNSQHRFCARVHEPTKGTIWVPMYDFCDEGNL